MVQAKFMGRIRAFAIVISFFCATVSAEEPADEALEEQFSIGMDALEHDRLETAREAFSSILSHNPGLHRARLELARVYYLSQDYEQARREAQTVLNDPNTPVHVRTTLLAFLAQIERDEKQVKKRHTWTPTIYLGFMHDSNVNVGPNRDVVNIGGTPFQLSDSSKERRDTAFVVNPGIAHTYNPDKTFTLAEHSGFFLWQSQLSGYYRRYFDETDFNLGVITLSTGPALVVPRHWRAGIGLQADQIWLGDGRLALFASVNPNVTWQFGDSTELTLDGIVTRRHYSQKRDAESDGWYRAASVSMGQYFNNRKFGVQGGAGYSRFDAKGGRFSHRGPDAFLGGIAQLWQDGSVYARAGYRKYDYRGDEPGFGMARDDDEYRYTVGFQHAIQRGPLASWALLGSWIHTNNNSDVPIFEYDRDQFNLGISRAF